jgi:dynactin complex subunit
MTMKLNEVQNELVKEDNLRGQVDVLMHDNRITVAKIKNLEIKLEELKLTSLTRSSRGSSDGRDLTMVSDQIATVGMILDAHRKHLE